MTITLLHSFIAGFAASREGFNGECAFAHQAPTKVYAGARSQYDSFDAVLRDEEAMRELGRLFDEWVQR